MIDIVIRQPEPTDGENVHQLINSCPPLDTNSLYCNLLQCSHFSEYCAIATHNDKVVGFVSGYVTPNEPERLFIWQVAVCSSARNNGLAKRMITHILSRHSSVTRLETSITPNNEASWALFNSLALDLDTQLVKSELFNKERHLAGRHETELLATIGPFKTANLTIQAA